DKTFKSMLSAERTKERDDRLSSRTRLPSGIGKGDEEDQQTFNLIIKAETQGSAEAVSGSVIQMGTDRVKINILHVGTGEISEADVMLAYASSALIIGFNVRIDPGAQRTADTYKIRIDLF